jgi:signal transduction histidine kinase
MSKDIAVNSGFAARRSLIASRGELLQVFSNIIANAIDALGSGGSLRLETREVINAGTAGIQIAICDEGSGIEAEHLSRIFEPFFTTKEQHGTGIGLWVAKQLVDKHGGRIEITSRTEAGNSGTEVCIFLPFDNSSSGPDANAGGISNLKM